MSRDSASEHLDHEDRRMEHEDAVEEAPAPVELEHVCGYSGSSPRTLHALPPQKGHEDHPTGKPYVCGMGAHIVLGDAADAHSQEFLPGHDEEVTAVAVERSGYLMATGQKGSRRAAGLEAPVIVWELPERRQVYNLFGLTRAVTFLEFSPDGRFLAASSSDCLLVVWDMRTGEQLVARKWPREVEFISWGPVDDSGRRPTYFLCIAVGGGHIHVCPVKHDPRQLRYGMEYELVSLPASGFARRYLCGHCLPDGVLLAGTSAGELAVFDCASRNFRAAFPVSSNGVTSIASSLADPSTIYVGGGDGTLRKFTGAGTDWECTADATPPLSGAIVSVSQLNSESDIALVGTADGAIHQLHLGGLEHMVLERAHTGGILSCGFGWEESGRVVTASGEDGTVRCWDLATYDQMWVAGPFRGASPCCVCVGGGDEVLVGMTDGTVRGLVGGEEKWRCVAHRGRVVAVVSGPGWFASGGGDDGALRLWTLDTRERLLEFAAHRGGVISVIRDALEADVVHSCGNDRQVVSWSFRTEKDRVRHQLPRSTAAAMTSLTQRLARTGEGYETQVISTSSDGRILCWDKDVPECPVSEVPPTETPRVALRASVASPSARFFATIGEDGVLRVYDTGLEHAARMAAHGIPSENPEPPRLLHEVPAHSLPANSLAWSPDEKQIVSVGDDGCIAIYNFYLALRPE